MGACHKCGKARVRKNKRGVRNCARCGVLTRFPAVSIDLPPGFVAEAVEPVEQTAKLKVQWRANP